MTAEASSSPWTAGPSDAPRHDATVEKPIAYRVVRLFLADGSDVLGLWTGQIFWARGVELSPTHWQEIKHRSPVVN